MPSIQGVTVQNLELNRMHPMQGKAPLAERMRPTTLDGYVGQAHLVGDGAVLRQAMRQALEGAYPAEYRLLLERYYQQVYEDAVQMERAP